MTRKLTGDCFQLGLLNVRTWHLNCLLSAFYSQVTYAIHPIYISSLHLHPRPASGLVEKPAYTDTPSGAKMADLQPESVNTPSAAEQSQTLIVA
jgi:hypothetical protein